MGLSKFNAPTLPDPPAAYDPQYIRQLLRTLEIYHNQLDSKTPNFAESYTADAFFGLFVARNVTTAEKILVPIAPETIGMILFDTDLQKLCVLTATGWQTITSV